MANVPVLVKEVEFDTVSVVVVNHNRNCDCLSVQLIASGAKQTNLIDRIELSVTDPDNSFTVYLKTVLTGKIQVFEESMLYTNLPSATEKSISQSSTTQTSTDPTTTDDLENGFRVGSRWINTSNDSEFVLTDATSGAAVWIETTGAGSSSHHYSLAIIGQLDKFPSFPYSGLSTEIITVNETKTLFQGVRASSGSAGITTVYLEHNGSLVSSAILSWTPNDANNAYKSVSISLAVSKGDRISLNLNSAEDNAQDIFTSL